MTPLSTCIVDFAYALMRKWSRTNVIGLYNDRLFFFVPVRRGGVWYGAIHQNVSFLTFSMCTRKRATISIIRTRHCSIRTNVRCEMVLRVVRHIPDFRANPISVIALDQEGNVQSFGDGHWRLATRSLVVAKARAYWYLVQDWREDTLKQSECISIPHFHRICGTRGLVIWARKAGRFLKKEISRSS